MMSKNHLKLGTAALALLFAGLACSLLGGEPKLESMQTARNQEGTQPATSFAQEDSFYLTGEMTGLGFDEATVKAIWTGVDLNNGEKDVNLKEDQQTMGNGKFWFSLFKTEGKWPAGSYRVDVFVNDALTQTLNFQVEPGPAVISNLVVTSDEAGDQPTSAFDPEDVFYIQFDLENPRPETKVKAVWTAVDVYGEQPDTLIKDQEEGGFENTGSYFLTLARTEGLWPPGKYKAEIYLDDQFVQEMAFEVVGEIPAPVGSLQNPYTALDEAGTIPSPNFAQADTIYAHFEIVDAPAEGAPIQGILKTLNVEGAAPETEVASAEGTVSSGPNFFRFTNSQPWTKGQYKVEYYLDGQLIDFVTLDVVSTNTSGARVDRAYASVDEAGSQETSVFGLSSPVYIQTTLADAPEDTDVRAVLVAVDPSAEKPYTYVTEAGGQFGSGDIFFTFTNDQGWAPGSYVVYIYLNGEAAQFVEFQVQ